MPSRENRTKQLCSSLCPVNNLKEESTCANDRKKKILGALIQANNFCSDVLPPITRVFYRSSEVFCATSPAMLQGKQIPNSLQVTQQYINLQFWRRIEMLHRQMSHNAKGTGKRSNFFSSLLGFVFILLQFYGLGLFFCFNYFNVPLLFCFSKY